eukprot:TRINITY_DN14854_c2_g1_i1.p1 TRINITY_DN14854_c2_g1~~TRINITY_DN14854_c2_g1_i1.p1  ORF type:complete len:329 (-),score=65.53 TRINITY_DN14854_c2_g1_i1:276-1262(-)
MVSRAEDARQELLRVRREMVMLDAQILQILKEIECMESPSDKQREDDARATRNSLWREKEHLREQETLFLKALFSEAQGLPPATMLQDFSSVSDGRLLPLAPPLSLQDILNPANGRGVGLGPRPLVLDVGPSQDPGSLLQQQQQQEQQRQHEESAIGLADPFVAGPSESPFGSDPVGGKEEELERGYEVNRSSDCKVIDVWREWKEGLNGGPSIEKLEENRKRDRKQMWWKHKNDYKYWSKQMRIIHAIEQKAAEYGDNIEAGIEYWEEILRVEFDSSISKLREALGGEKTPNDGSSSDAKRMRKELLQAGMERLKRWPGGTPATGLL